METKEIFKRIEEVEYLLKYYNLGTCTGEDHTLNVLIRAVGQMGEAHSLISKLMDEVEPKDDTDTK